MEGNFLSRYNNKLSEWSKLIDDDPSNKGKYQDEMSKYMIKCMPFLTQYMESENEQMTYTNTDNIFDVKETVGLKRKDIWTDYLVDVEKKNIFYIYMIRVI
jgi:hypothetical protein